MRISTKGRYGLAAMIVLGQSYNSGEHITIISISERLGISKIYLEQVFSQLKQAGLITSIKGAGGGYYLAYDPQEITVFDILSATEASLFEKTEESVSKHYEAIEKTMQNLVWGELDKSIQSTLKSITLKDLINQTGKYTGGYMYYI